jgi:hypothetical protein
MHSNRLFAEAESADEQWDETLDSLAIAVARDLAAKRLLRKGAQNAARFHFRGYARRLLNPLLDQVRAEVQSGYREVLDLREENLQLKQLLADAERRRRRALFAILTLSVLALTTVLAAGLLLRASAAPHARLGVSPDYPETPATGAPSPRLARLTVDPAEPTSR